MATKQNNSRFNLVKKITLVGLLTALAVALSYIKIPLIGSATVTLVLPVVVIGAALCGPWVGAWLTVIPNILAFSEAGIFLVNAPFGCVLTLISKGLLAGFFAGVVYKVLSKKSKTGAVICSAIVAPVLNSGTFVLGCYVFIWDELVALAGASGVGIGLLLIGLAGLNFVVELVLNLILCPSILRIIHIINKNN